MVTVGWTGRDYVLAVARFVRCIPGDGPDAALLSAHERAFGIYGPGRYSWVLDAVRPLREPIHAKGMLRPTGVGAAG